MPSSAIRRFWAAANFGKNSDGTIKRNFGKFTKAACPALRICAATGLKKHGSKLKKENANARACWRRKEFAAVQTAKCLKASKKLATSFLPRVTVNGFLMVLWFTSAWWVLMMAANPSGFLTAYEHLSFTRTLLQHRIRLLRKS